MNRNGLACHHVNNDAAPITTQDSLTGNREKKRKHFENIKKDEIPCLPENWDRCQAYVAKKQRFCRQMINPNTPVSRLGQPIYCGNHYHLYTTHTKHDISKKEDALCQSERHVSRESKDNQTVCMSEGVKKDRGKRIPCPLDPSHFIYETQLEKHLKRCPRAKQKEDEISRQYYEENINKGGFGSFMHIPETQIDVQISDEMDSNEIEALALQVLDTFDRIFIQPNMKKTSKSYDSKVKRIRDDDYLRSLSFHDMYNSIPFVDHSELEREKGMESELELHRIKIGSKHTQQIGSIVGHLRSMGLFSTCFTGEREKFSKRQPDIILELGAGRGTTGYVVASALAADLHNTNEKAKKIQLVMVERAGMRAKADRVFRRADEPIRENIQSVTSSLVQTENNNVVKKCHYFKVQNVESTRVKCDLAHVNLSCALKQSSHINFQEGDTNIAAVAKHLCGVGTDLALKSMKSVRSEIIGCAIATCCHHICKWEDYVGRDYLHSVMIDKHNQEGNTFQFGSKEFSMMARWTSASVLKERSLHNNDTGFTEISHNSDDKTLSTVQNKTQYKGKVTDVIQKMRLKCGARGLGRACQRLIDFGRCQYMKHELFVNDSVNLMAVVDMCHYVKEEITPQNALLRGFYQNR